MNLTMRQIRTIRACTDRQTPLVLLDPFDRSWVVSRMPPEEFVVHARATYAILAYDRALGRPFRLTRANVASDSTKGRIIRG